MAGKRENFTEACSRRLEMVQIENADVLYIIQSRDHEGAFFEHDTPRKIDTRIESALKDFNEDLKEMAEAVGWERKFTSYSLRHGFATHLRNNEVHISIIKEALGHELEQQTIVYLDDLDDQPVADEINRALSFTSKKNRKAKRKGRGI